MSESESCNFEAEGFDGESAKLFFVDLIKQNPIILSRSQTSSVIFRKREALKHMTEVLKYQLGQTLNEKQILKKVNNMKTRVNRKVMLIESNKNVRMTEWEQMFIDLLNEETDPGTNPGKIQYYPQYHRPLVR